MNVSGTKTIELKLNSLRPRQNGSQYPDDIFKCIFLTENVIISIKISLQFVPKGSINNIPTLVQIMAWRRPGDKPLSEPMMVRLSMHICVTRLQWVNCFECCYNLPKTITMSVLFGPGGLYVRLWTGSGFVKLLDWRIFFAEPLFKPLQTSSKHVRKGALFLQRSCYARYTPQDISEHFY